MNVAQTHAQIQMLKLIYGCEALRLPSLHKIDSIVILQHHPKYLLCLIQAPEAVPRRPRACCGAAGRPNVAPTLMACA